MTETIWQNIMYLKSNEATRTSSWISAEDITNQLSVSAASRSCFTFTHNWELGMKYQKKSEKR